MSRGLDQQVDVLAFPTSLPWPPSAGCRPGELAWDCRRRDEPRCDCCEMGCQFPKKPRVEDVCNLEQQRKERDPASSPLGCTGGGTAEWTLWGVTSTPTTFTNGMPEDRGSRRRGAS